MTSKESKIMRYATQTFGRGLSTSALAVFAALALALTGCAVAQPDVNRVQTNVVDKTVFDGEWWYASTIIDVDTDEATVLSGGGFAPFTGSMSMIDFGYDNGQSFTMARIRWVLDENFLYAYRAYELIDGGNDNGRSPDFRGQPLAAFAIQDHFDVRREYNAVTGEPSNVIAENSSDRRWYERQFVRVDWSTNLITPFYANYGPQIAQLFNVLQPEPVPFDFQTGAHGEMCGDAPCFPKSYEPQFTRVSDDPTYRFRDEWPANAGNTIHYMSFVNQEVWSPGASCFSFGGLCSSAAVTVRSSFLRVPPNHEYASDSQSHQEFDRFGLFRSYQRTYVRGGEDRGVVADHCAGDGECGAGGFCGPSHTCEGGLSRDYGETDFLAFYRPKHNLYSNSLAEVTCRADWECDNRYGDAPLGAPGPGSQCDRSARRCTTPVAMRGLRPVTYHLNAGFPAHLTRTAFQIVGDWNEAFMRGQRGAIGVAAMDATGVRIDTQSVDPTQYCWQSTDATMKAPEVDADGKCDYKYDPFQDPAAAGVMNPYQCHIVGPADVAHPTAYEDYGVDAFSYRFEGPECMFFLRANSCDATPGAACEELGDIRYQFFNYIEHGAVGFGGVSLPLMDPRSGELITSNANMAAESIESVATTASQFFPVLRGETPEDEYFTGEYLRGYYSRVGQNELPVALANSGTDGYTNTDPTRPAMPIDLHDGIIDRLERMSPNFERLHGMEGRALIHSDRMRNLAGTSVERRMSAAVGLEAVDARVGMQNLDPGLMGLPADSIATNPAIMDRTSPFRGNVIGAADRDRLRAEFNSRRNIDPRLDDNAAIYNSTNWQYWANAFGTMGDAATRNKEASVRMQQAFLRAVMYHELGHSVGLRHNFAGSFDRNNYYDGYFNIARALPLPYYQDYDLTANGGNADGQLNGQELNNYQTDLRRVRQERGALGIGNTMSGSIMDYHGDLSDLSGIGRYDIAATMWNYFNVKEAYTADPEISSPQRNLDGLHESDVVGRTLMPVYRGGDSCSADTDCPSARGRARLPGQRATLTGSVDLSVTFGELNGSTAVFVMDGRPAVEVTFEGNGSADDVIADINAAFDAAFDVSVASLGPGGVLVLTSAATAADLSRFPPEYSSFERTGGTATVANLGIASAPFAQKCIKNPRYAPVPERCEGDRNCLCSTFDEDFKDYAAVGTPAVFPTKYLFCGDERTSDISWCNRFDAGESFQESVDNYRRTWEEGYPRAYYRNYRRGGARGRATYGAIQDAAKIYQHLFFRYFNEPEFRSQNGPLGVDDQYTACVDTMNWFAEIIALPDVGAYELDTAANIYRRVSDNPDAAGADFGLRPGAGFHMWSAYQTGQNGFFRMERAGTFNDKIFAMYALALRDWNLSFTIDERYFINFYDLFPLEMTEFFGAYIQGNTRGFAPRVKMSAAGPTIQHLNWWRGNTTCGLGGVFPCRGTIEATYLEPAIDGTSTELLRDWAAILSLAQFPVFYDTSFEQRLMIYKAGNGDGADIPAFRPDGTPTCEFGAPGCTLPDYITYDSDALHTTFIAVIIRPRYDFNLPEEELGSNLLKRIRGLQDQARVLEAIPTPTAAQVAQARALRVELASEDSFLEYLIEIQRTYGISSYL